MIGSKLKEAFELKPHLIDGIFQYENLQGLNDAESKFFNLGSIAFRPMIFNEEKFLRASVFGVVVEISKHSASKFKGQNEVQSYLIKSSLAVSDGTMIKSTVVADAVLDSEMFEEDYLKGLIRDQVLDILGRVVDGKLGGNNDGRD